jgi:exosortase D (VPLPA-CTERM-specific)
MGSATYALVPDRDVIVRRMTIQSWAAITIGLVVVYLICRESVDQMITGWIKREEYSHGFLIPLISAYLIWQRSDKLRELKFDGSWIGFTVVLAGLLVILIGDLATLFSIVQYGFLFVLLGLAWAFLGGRAFRYVFVPMLILFFMVPLPHFLYQNLSTKLQLISSEIGVWTIRLFDISVYLEGNVIDLGGYKLQVVEACNGLRYLFPLMTLGFILAYFYQAALWKRVFIFVSTIPITVLMNSFRIGVIGITVEYWGEEMAEGFLHDFEGWAIFMVCFGVLFVEMWLLTRLTGDRRPFNHVFGIDAPAPAPDGARRVEQVLSKPFVAALVVVVVAAGAVMATPNRQEVPPPRQALETFPLELGSWQGATHVMEQGYIKTLKFEDYLLASYRNAEGEILNWYIAYYESQRKGESAHSPRSCLPGSGWEIEKLERHAVDGVEVAGTPLRVNRVEMSFGNERQLVYYWFLQRGRNITNEYAVKWYLFWDALTRNRTDGALIRLIIRVPEGQATEVYDEKLSDFMKLAAPELTRYVPD